MSVTRLIFLLEKVLQGRQTPAIQWAHRRLFLILCFDCTRVCKSWPCSHLNPNPGAVLFSLLVCSTTKGVWQIPRLRLICPDPCATIQGRPSGTLEIKRSFCHFKLFQVESHNPTDSTVGYMVNKKKNSSGTAFFSWVSKPCTLTLFAFWVLAFWAEMENSKPLLVIAAVITRRDSERAWKSFLKNKYSCSKILKSPFEILPIIGPDWRLKAFWKDQVCIFRGKINTCMENKEPSIWLQWFKTPAKINSSQINWLQQLKTRMFDK